MEKIKKIPQGKPWGQIWIWCTILLIFVCPFLIGMVGLPSWIRYFADLCWGILLALTLVYRKRLAGAIPFCWWIGAFLAYVALAYCFLFQSPYYFLWGLRNNFRFYAFFLAVAALVRRKDRKQYILCLDVLFWVNLAVTLFQFLVLDYEGDFLGGLFGVEKGVNGHTNIFLVIYLTKTLLWCLNGEENIVLSFWKILLCMLITAMAELKFFFIEAVVITVLCLALTSFSWKKVLVLLVSALALVLGGVLLLRYFPEFAWFFQWDRLLESVLTDRGYTYTGDLNRLNAIGRISRELMDPPWDMLFGFGLGNCDTASFGFLQTPFYARYEPLHYSWMSHSFVYLEMGWVGMLFFFGFFGLVWWQADKVRRRKDNNQPYCQLAMVVAAVCCLIGIYNSSLRTEAGYMAYLVMAFPFVKQKKKKAKPAPAVENTTGEE